MKQKNYQLICLPHFVLVLFFYKPHFFSEFSIQILNGCIFDNHFDFPHDFKATYTVQAYEFDVKMDKTFKFFNKNDTVHKLMHHLGSLYAVHRSIESPRMAYIWGTFAYLKAPQNW